MKINLISILLSMAVIKFANPKKYRVHPDDEMLPYDIAKDVESPFEYFNYDNMVYEQIDDGYVQLSGHILILKSWDRNIPPQISVRTQFYDRSMWNEGLLRLTIVNLCKEYINPSRLWYNITKLWTDCPPQKGVKWPIEQQQLTGIFDLPSGTPIVPWKAYILVSQGTPGFEVFRVGFSNKFEFEIV